LATVAVMVVFLIVMAIIAIAVYELSVEKLDSGEGQLGLSFAATMILIVFVFFLAIYLGRMQRRGRGMSLQ
jgi:heme/copper-type cytochrome/quinol oxidase subunit 2